MNYIIWNTFTPIHDTLLKFTTSEILFEAPEGNGTSNTSPAILHIVGK